MTALDIQKTCEKKECLPIIKFQNKKALFRPLQTKNFLGTKEYCISSGDIQSQLSGKKLFANYVNFHDTWEVFPTLERIILNSNMCYINNLDYSSINSPTIILPEIFIKDKLIPKVVMETERKEISHKFVPSDDLANAIYDLSIKPDKSYLEFLKIYNKNMGDEEIKEDKPKNLAKLVSDRIEDLLVTIVDREETSPDKYLSITDNKNFKPEIRNELVERLCLDPYDLKEVIDSLYSELLIYATTFNPIRNWGSIKVEDSYNIIIEIDRENAFDDPDLD